MEPRAGVGLSDLSDQTDRIRSHIVGVGPLGSWMPLGWQAD
jgi:hypothetical protein